ncbi:MAG: lipopolysaccharide biosynthesis protein [Bacteroidales bacterium]|nr:lipopolysaccharide biosynthesis protein [Bacteroidales bacterium]
MADDLKQKAISGARWGFIENLSSLAVTFVVAFILQRWFLSPHEFGLVGHLAIFIAISISFIDNGFSAAIIKKPEPSRHDLSTTFVTNLVISLVCFGILQVAAPYVASYFDEPQLKALLRVLSLVLIINAVSIIQRVLLVKAVDFRSLTKCSVSASVVSGIVGIWMAFRGYGVWSLVGQQISRQLVNTLMLWIVGSWKVSLVFSRRSFRELFSYGSNVLFTGLLDTVFKNIYFPVIGKGFGTDVLGQYTGAEKYSNVTSNNLSQVVQRVSFPVLSKVQDDIPRLKNAFRTILKVVMTVSVMVSFCLSVLSYPFIVGLVGERWAQAAHILSIICIAGAFFPAHYLYQNILQVRGKMKLYLAMDILKKVLMAVSIVIGIVFKDLDILLWGLVAASVLTFVIYAYCSGRVIGYTPLEQLRDLLPMFLACIVISLIVGLVSGTFQVLCFNNLWYDPTWTNLASVAVALIVGALLVVAFWKFLPKKETREIKNLISFWKRGS